ncbi:DUF2017 domain-containing protein [Planosporangium flavigriseum]|uniref:DUF2017 domain-containing protein n=1 Tax=Planosporangium flavigriseum TaxID=373681 RepID=A0A8J3LIN9_9ACTN|nr:DUF2017 domain-containing protein [Planosporangium flavigriseum]NJC66962.1 DUF2017 domain-containing protein [Planosporangium flavigriseum]GIG73973.1 hypothetical protein Pfl04_23770 [Planosporangium flavigriseum]
MFKREGDVCVGRFDQAEAAVLQQVMVEMVTLLSERLDHADPVVARLFPDVYRDDPDVSADLRRYTEADLKAAKLDQAGEMLAAVPPEGGEVRLDDEGAEAWLRALTDARLALGLQLGIRDDTDLVEELDEAVARDPISVRVAQLSVYAYLSQLQESLLEALTG